MKLFQAIREARDRKGITLRELGEKTGTASGTLSQIETGHIQEPSFRLIVKIAKALGISLNKLAETD